MEALIVAVGSHKNIQLVSRSSRHHKSSGWELVFDKYLPVTLSEFCVGPLPPHQMIRIDKVPIAMSKPSLVTQSLIIHIHETHLCNDRNDFHQAFWSDIIPCTGPQFRRMNIQGMLISLRVSQHNDILVCLAMVS